MIVRCAADLLRRHVTRRAEHDAGIGVGPGRGRAGFDVTGRVEQLGDAEVEDLRARVGSDEHVVGLQVAMDDALVVRRARPVAICTV